MVTNSTVRPTPPRLGRGDTAGTPPETQKRSILNRELTKQYARRTPLTRAKKGGFRDTSADGLLYKLLKTGIAESGVKPEQVQDIIAGECRLSTSGVYSAIFAG